MFNYNDCLSWYDIGIGQRAAIMAQGRRPKAEDHYGFLKVNT